MDGVKTLLAPKYDDSTAVIMADSGHIKGDAFPDIRGLLHIKNEIEQKLFSKSEERCHILFIMWSSQYKELGSFLE